MNISKVPTEVLAQILKYVAQSQFNDSRYVFDTHVLAQSLDRDERSDIASLRLVNRTLHRLATPILFKYFNAGFPAYDLITPDTWTVRLLEISQSPVVEEIQNLDIGVRIRSSTNRLERYLIEAALVLPAFVHACKKLKGLRIYCSTSFTEVMDHEDNQNLFLKTVEHIFRRIAPNARCCTFQALELTLPLGYDFANLANTSTEHSPELYSRSILHFMKDLKHLHLEISDNSGFGGQRYFSSVESKRHRMHPNKLHATDFFHFATLPDHLHSLTICATHILDMDILDTLNLRSLQTLQLTGIKISQKTLSAISSQNVSTLKSIDLDLVELKSGTWESMLLEFCILPYLERFWINSCGYLYAPFNNRDRYALGSLQRHVNQVRTLAGDEPFTSNDYRYTELESQETSDLD